MSNTSSANHEVTDHVCWVCLDSGLGDVPNETWSRPCRCRGALKWVHLSCLHRWIDEQQSTRGQNAPVYCRACGAQYEIVYPPASLLFQLLESLDVKTKALSYYFAGGLLLGSFYWSAVTYGAVTVMQVLGHQQGLQMMRRTDPLLLLLGLPTIPACLLLLRTVPWENFLVVLWRHYLSRLIPFRWLTGTSNWPAREAIVDSSSEGHEFPRFLCASLTLPSVAAMTGQLLFPKVRTNTRRILLGALAYLGLKGLLSVSYTEMKYMRACHRIVKNYEGD